MNAALGTQLLVIAIGAGWTVIFYFVKRTLASIDRKLEENRGQNDSLHVKVGRALAARGGVCQRQYVSRQEFGAFTATINHKIDSIYEFLKKDERTLDR